jgi:hypothetical protein
MALLVVSPPNSGSHSYRIHMPREKRRRAMDSEGVRNRTTLMRKLIWNHSLRHKRPQTRAENARHVLPSKEYCKQSLPSRMRSVSA